MNPERPIFDFEVPREYTVLADRGIVGFEPHSILEPWYFVREGEIRNFPSQVRPFARRQDNDDVACFELDERGRVVDVVLVHGWTPDGHRIVERFGNIRAWLRSALDDVAEILAASEAPEHSPLPFPAPPGFLWIQKKGFVTSDPASSPLRPWHATEELNALEVWPNQPGPTRYVCFAAGSRDGALACFEVVRDAVSRILVVRRGGDGHSVQAAYDDFFAWLRAAINDAIDAESAR